MPPRAVPTLAATCLLLIALTGCSSASSATPANDDANGALTGDPAQASCDDPDGDGGSFDIQNVEVTKADGELKVKFTTSGVPAFKDTESVILSVHDASGDGGAMLGTKWTSDSSNPIQYVYDNSTGTQFYDDSTAKVAGGMVTATFTANLLPPLGDDWNWTATTSVDGTDEDTCTTT